MFDRRTLSVVCLTLLLSTSAFAQAGGGVGGGGGVALVARAELAAVRAQVAALQQAARVLRAAARPRVRARQVLQGTTCSQERVHIPE
jgi:hypothetical protein